MVVSTACRVEGIAALILGSARPSFCSLTHVQHDSRRPRQPQFGRSNGLGGKCQQVIEWFVVLPSLTDGGETGSGEQALRNTGQTPQAGDAIAWNFAHTHPKLSRMARFADGGSSRSSESMSPNFLRRMK